MTRDDIPGASPAKPRLLYMVTEDWAFLSHRLPMARAARDAGFEVHVATRVSRGAQQLRQLGDIRRDPPRLVFGE